MKILLCVVTFAFAALSMLAALTQLKKAEHKAPHALMLSGGALMLGAMVACLLGWGADIILALVGGGLICGAAIYNGKSSGSFHWQHHVVRGIVTILLAVGFALL